VDQPLETYQDEIYLAGLGGVTPDLPTDLNELERAAAGRLTPGAYAYIAGSAGSGDTARENREAFRRWRIVPRMLTDVSSPSYASTVLGAGLAVPFLLAPVGVLGLAHPDGEVAVARAAAACGVPMVLSTVSSTAMEEVAEASGDGQRWFQLYWPQDRAVAASFLARAKAAGFTALVITLDTRLLAWRPRDLDQSFQPFLRGIGIQNYLTDPAFQASLAALDSAGLAAPASAGQASAGRASAGRPSAGRASAGRASADPASADPASAEPASADLAAAILQFTRIFGDRTLTWEDLSFARDHWDGPIVVKGVLSVADAERAAGAGMDGIIVSNHGGRQVDGAIAALDALPAIAAAVGSRVTVLFDSGIRGGSDMLKALALGARAVLIGRPYAFGLGMGGQDGVRHVLRALRNDFELTMRLSGYASLDELSPQSLVRTGPSS
jgi:L-lactate dehydrogenase (cytochrome)